MEAATGPAVKLAREGATPKTFDHILSLTFNCKSYILTHYYSQNSWILEFPVNSYNSFHHLPKL